ncbi:Chromatin structure-remodeling complex protein RSC8 [Smittium mucronatum]|uniref:Chromatin structure-remodeling complex protein RSC8 n=1 Tax=Smittium mucronatum TaxID=133383 RepID=A0A1R0GQG4_9FUNG|nr:Chromatin structure-remodeling complex protein RSC8 [Smittium mucronatum]
MIVNTFNHMSLVHERFSPDSLDIWIPESQATDLSSISASETPKVIRLSHKWLIDSSKYSEWMNFADYEVSVSFPDNDSIISPPINSEAPIIAHTIPISKKDIIFPDFKDNETSNISVDNDIDLESGEEFESDSQTEILSNDPIPHIPSIDKSVELNSEIPGVQVADLQDLQKQNLKKKNELEPISFGKISNLENISQSVTPSDVFNHNTNPLTINITDKSINPSDPSQLPIPSSTSSDNHFNSTSNEALKNDTPSAATNIPNTEEILAPNPDSISSFIPPIPNSAQIADSAISKTPNENLQNETPKDTQEDVQFASQNDITETSILNQESLNNPNYINEFSVTIKDAEISEQLVPDSTTKVEQVVAEQKYEVIIPSYSAWFDLSQIHENEKNSNPEFFNGLNKSKTPQIYMEYRNFMINTYRLCPIEYLTVTACRRNLAGDVCSIMRVHAFLEQWGLINYQVDPETKPSLISPPFTGHFRITAETPRGLAPYFPNVPVYQNPPSSESISGSEKNSVHDPNLPKKATSNPFLNRTSGPIDTKNNIYNSSSSIDSQNDKSSVCFTCGNDIDESKYHCVKPTRQKIDLCSPCFLDGRFPSYLNSSDFVKLSQKDTKATDPHIRPDKWTDQETLLLLEGIEMYDEDWTKISEHVSTRSREECVLHFLQLPIEDNEVINIREVNNNLLNEFSPPGANQYIPFSKADNPVMSVVAFLASNVNPAVAAAAAKEALRVLANLKKRHPSNPDKKEFKESLRTSNDSSIPSTKNNPDNDLDNPTQSMGVSNSDSTNLNNEIIDNSNSEVHSSKPKPHFEPPNKDTQQVAASLALSAAAAKASQLADREEASMQLLVHQAIELQLTKLEYKVKILEEMQQTIEQERYDLAKQRLALAQERIFFRKDSSRADNMSALKSGANVGDLHTNGQVDLSVPPLSEISSVSAANFGNSSSNGVFSGTSLKRKVISTENSDNILEVSNNESLNSSTKRPNIQTTSHNMSILDGDKSIEDSGTTNVENTLPSKPTPLINNCNDIAVSSDTPQLNIPEFLSTSISSLPSKSPVFFSSETLDSINPLDQLSKVHNSPLLSLGSSKDEHTQTTIGMMDYITQTPGVLANPLGNGIKDLIESGNSLIKESGNVSNLTSTFDNEVSRSTENLKNSSRNDALIDSKQTGDTISEEKN